MTYKYFLTSWPHGKLRLVEILGEHPSIKDGVYIRYLDEKGGTDTTTNNFLFDVPATDLETELKSKVIRLQRKIQTAGKILSNNVTLTAPTYVLNAVFALEYKSEPED